MSGILKDWKPAQAGVKHVVSVSLGSSRGNSREETILLGQPLILERIGTDGDKLLAASLLKALDGKVDAFGLGGADLYVFANNKRYIFEQVKSLIAHAQNTPVLDGSGLKNTLERDAIAQLDGALDWKQQKVLMVSAVDRFGMAEALAEHQAKVIYGDLIFGLNINKPIHSIEGLRKIARLALPILTKLPQDWFYPTGKKQVQSVEGKGTHYYEWADVIAGDTHYAKRYAPPNLEGKTILTQTITPADRTWMKERGVAKLITTTPRIGSRNFATNVLEAAFVALSGTRQPLTQDQYLDYIHQVGFHPEINEF